MTDKVMTEVSAVVADERGAEVEAEFAALLAGSFPDGLERTELLRGDHGEWRIQTLWRDRAALDAMRAGSEPPAAPALFKRLGAEPTLRIYAVAATQLTAAPGPRE